jgi:putative FmdB family regulatory protein
MTYEYQCLACQNEWEAEQSISEPPLTECPKCHEPKAKRMVSGGAGFILKGGGWYADGYGSKSGAAKDDKSEKTDKSSESGNSSSSSTTDTKKETKKAGDAGSSESNSKGKSAST